VSSAVSAVVVNYESGDVLARCVESLLDDGAAEVVVVDNGSADGSLRTLRQHVPEAVVVESGRNLGYGAAANRGVAATSAPVVVVCNPDLLIGRGALAAMADALDEDPDCAAVGPRILTADGDRYPSARRFPSLLDAAGHAALGLLAPGNRFTRAYQLDRPAWSEEEPTAVDWVSGACFAVRRSAFEAVGGFDESYFMYVEDVDLCWRLGHAGWTVRYWPAASVTHRQGVSTDRHPYRMILEHHRSLLRFAGRSSGGWRRAFLPLVAVGIACRAALACLLRAGRRRRPPIRRA
jgi:N-acetylglucosaminyl-diphospho-decaprenol L-rhamnosyltransferase